MLQNSISVDMKVYVLQLKQKSTWVLQFQVFTFSSAVIFQIMKQCSFSTKFSIAEPFKLNYVINLYIPKKGLSSPDFTMKILAATIFGSY